MSADGDFARTVTRITEQVTTRIEADPFTAADVLDAAAALIREERFITDLYLYGSTPTRYRWNQHAAVQAQFNELMEAT